MNKIDLGNNQLNRALLYMIIAYAFSYAIRLIWVVQMGDMENFYWNDQLMINTNDGYYFATAAQKVLEGLHLSNPRLPDWLSSGVIFFTVMLTKITPFSLDTVILYLPSVISSLVVIPMILIGRLYGSALFGFMAALIGSIAWSYYNRTMTGYYDTDMFSAMMPMFILYFLLATLETEKRIFMLLSSLTIMIYPFLYDSGLSLIYAMGLLYIGYMFLFHRKENFTYESTILISIALMGIPVWFKLVLIVGLYLFFSRAQIERSKLILIALATVLLFLYTGNVFNLIWAKFSTYVFRGVDESGGLKFYEVAQTVREAGTIPFETMANRIIGSSLGVIAALAGYIILVIRHRGFILALPLIGIGVFSLWGGLRFTVYAVPVASLSIVYLFYFIARYINKPSLRLGFIALMTAVVIYPNITHILAYKVPTVFSKPEVAALDRLSKIGSDKDYIVTWWDYGYPLWYYGQKNTLIDGGKHNHDNFLVSEILLSTSQKEAARLSRIAIETYVDSNYSVVADTLFKNHQKDQIDVSAYLENLRYGSVELPKKSREVFLYLPMRMFDILPTVKIFSNLDLTTGRPLSKPFFYSAQRFNDTKNSINFGNGIALLKQEGKIQIGAQKIPLGEFIKVGYNQQGKIIVNRQSISPMSRISIIYLESYHRFLILDSEYLNSNFIQMFVFENYDHDLFEPVVLTPESKIFRVKI